MAGVTYVLDEATEAAGLRIWGSPWQPWFHDWAFNLPRGLPAARQVGPDPVRHRHPGDPRPAVRLSGLAGLPVMAWREDGIDVEHVGCEELALVPSTACSRRLHMFGHIHEGYGQANSATRCWSMPPTATRTTNRSTPRGHRPAVNPLLFVYGTLLSSVDHPCAGVWPRSRADRRATFRAGSTAWPGTRAWWTARTETSSTASSTASGSRAKRSSGWTSSRASPVASRASPEDVGRVERSRRTRHRLDRRVGVPVTRQCDHLIPGGLVGSG